jgi:hypothetical protein
MEVLLLNKTHYFIEDYIVDSSVDVINNNSDKIILCVKRVVPEPDVYSKSNFINIGEMLKKETCVLYYVNKDSCRYQYLGEITNGEEYFYKEINGKHYFLVGIPADEAAMFTYKLYQCNTNDFEQCIANNPMKRMSYLNIAATPGLFHNYLAYKMQFDVLRGLFNKANFLHYDSGGKEIIYDFNSSINITNDIDADNYIFFYTKENLENPEFLKNEEKYINESIASIINNSNYDPFFHGDVIDSTIQTQQISRHTDIARLAQSVSNKVDIIKYFKDLNEIDRKTGSKFHNAKTRRDEKFNSCLKEARRYYDLNIDKCKYYIDRINYNEKGQRKYFYNLFKTKFEGGIYKLSIYNSPTRKFIEINDFKEEDNLPDDSIKINHLFYLSGGNIGCYYNFQYLNTLKYNNNNNEYLPLDNIYNNERISDALLDTSINVNRLIIDTLNPEYQSYYEKEYYELIEDDQTDENKRLKFQVNKWGLNVINILNITDILYESELSQTDFNTYTFDRGDGSIVTLKYHHNNERLYKMVPINNSSDGDNPSDTPVQYSQGLFTPLGKFSDDLLSIFSEENRNKIKDDVLHISKFEDDINAIVQNFKGYAKTHGIDLNLYYPLRHFKFSKFDNYNNNFIVRKFKVEINSARKYTITLIEDKTGNDEDDKEDAKYDVKCDNYADEWEIVETFKEKDNRGKYTEKEFNLSEYNEKYNLDNIKERDNQQASDHTSWDKIIKYKREGVIEDSIPYNYLYNTNLQLHRDGVSGHYYLIDSHNGMNSKYSENDIVRPSQLKKFFGHAHKIHNKNGQNYQTGTPKYDNSLPSDPLIIKNNDTLKTPKRRVGKRKHSNSEVSVDSTPANQNTDMVDYLKPTAPPIPPQPSQTSPAASASSNKNRFNFDWLRLPQLRLPRLRLPQLGSPLPRTANTSSKGGVTRRSKIDLRRKSRRLHRKPTRRNKVRNDKVRKTSKCNR